MLRALREHYRSDRYLRKVMNRLSKHPQGIAIPRSSCILCHAKPTTSQLHTYSPKSRLEETFVLVSNGKWSNESSSQPPRHLRSRSRLLTSLILILSTASPCAANCDHTHTISTHHFTMAAAVMRNQVTVPILSGEEEGTNGAFWFALSWL